MSIERRRVVAELHAPARKNFLRRRVIVRGYDDLWQADVVEMRPYARFNRGYNYILTVIDVLSKFAWAVPLKTKTGNEVARALATIVRDGARSPKNLQTDHGKEFYNADALNDALHDETRHQSLSDVFSNESIGSRTF